jgi:hypothetical protein
MHAVRDEETEDHDLLHERLPPVQSSVCSLGRLVCACFVFVCLVSWATVYTVRHTNADALQEYTDSQCISDFSAKEFEEYLSIIETGGSKVCSLKMRATYVPIERGTALLGMAATDDVRNIVNTGTRIPSMSIECDPARASTYPKECVSEHGFYYASLADYRSDVQRVVDGRIYRAAKVIVLIVNPFDAAYRIYRRKKACSGYAIFRFGCDVDKSPKIDEAELLKPAYFEFTRTIFSEWVRFMDEVESLERINKTYVYLDDLINVRKRTETAALIYGTIFDELLSPEVEDSITCLLREEQDKRVFPVEYNKSYANFYTNSSMEELCSMVQEYWNTERWTNECK